MTAELPSKDEIIAITLPSAYRQAGIRGRVITGLFFEQSQVVEYWK